MINISIQKHNFDSPQFIDLIKQITSVILKDYNKETSEINFVLCDNDFIQALNHDYRAKDSPTDVLSFSQEEGEDIDKDTGDFPHQLGDVIISLDMAKSQSTEYGVPFDEEVIRLAIHGVLHLLGFDHETSAEDEQEMMKIQDEYINKLKVES